MKMKCSQLEIKISTQPENSKPVHPTLEIHQRLKVIEQWSHTIVPKCISIFKNHRLSVQELRQLVDACMRHWSKSEIRIVIDADSMPDNLSLPEFLEETQTLLEIRTGLKTPLTVTLKHQIERWQRTYFFNVVYTETQSDRQRNHALITAPGLRAFNNYTSFPIDNGKVDYSAHTENRRPVNQIDNHALSNINAPFFNDDKIKLGFCIPTMSMGGVTRSLLTMMNAPDQHHLGWSGIAIRNAYAFDRETARLILEHCPIYSSMDHPDFQGLVTIVGNACQWIVDQSDVVNLWGYTVPNKELNHTNWKKKPMLIVAHGQNEWTRTNIHTSLSYPERSILVSVSKGGIQTFPEHLREHVKLIYNGVDLNHCKPHLSRDEIRRSWGISSDKIAIGYLGRFAKGKNVFAAAQAVSLLGENYHAVYIGEGIDKSHVINGVKERCGQRCSFMPRTEDIGSVLSGLDCLISASPSEGGPLSVAEAWITGCPVVSTPVGFIPELEANYGPLVVPLPHDPTPAQLATGVKNAIRGGPEIQRAQEVAFKEFNAVQMVKKYESLLAENLRQQSATYS